MLLRAVDSSLLLILMLLALGAVLLVVRVSPVTVVWETASEVGTAGYNIHRSPDAPLTNGLTWTKINAALIPAQGDEVMGARYRYEDHDVWPGRRYLYRIEEVEWSGTLLLYPDTVRVRAGLPVLWMRFQGVALMLVAALVSWRKVKRSCPG
jgi:hypothetical protein